MRSLLRSLVLALWCSAVAMTAHAAVPQTITVDGQITGWDPANLLSDDSDDTQPFCAVPFPTRPLDARRVYVTNDANFLYVGFELQDACFCNMNWGFAIDVNTAAGGTTDPFGRKIGWANQAFKPDWIVYDVPPNNSGQSGCNTFNFEALYKDSLGTWLNKGALVNPTYGSGSNGLGIVDSAGFKELKLPLSVLGVTTGNVIRLEFWVTQEGTTKGPLDAVFSDNVQMSRFSTTTFDTAAVVQMTQMQTYTILNAVDNIAPTMQSAQAVNFPLLANRQFNLGTNRIDLVFSEPVDLTTSQNTANYAFSGPVTRSITGATRDAVALNVVHLQLNTTISANALAFQITATGVKDIAGNTIVANGTTNVGGFFIHNLTFQGDFRLPLCSGTSVPADTFAVEGNVTPLTFGLCDNAFMTDANGDSVYQITVPFSLIRNPGTGVGAQNLEWKFSRKCSEFEPLPANRSTTISSANGAGTTLAFAWNDDNPANYTTRPVRVVFKVDATRFNPTGSDVVTLLGDRLPLSFTQPGLAMLDNGVAPDQVAGDKIYTRQVDFPACSFKDVNWKVDFNGVIECFEQDNRKLFLNDALFSVANPIVLPARGINRCSVTDKPVTVVFKVDMSPALGASPAFTPGADSVAVAGDRLPLQFGYPSPAALMFDNGTGFDERAGDGIYARAVTFPDSTPIQLGFKYYRSIPNDLDLANRLECAGGVPNRALQIDDVQFSVGNPLVRLWNVWNFCSDPTGVPSTSRTDGLSFGVLRPVAPNPVSRRARFAFELRRAGRVTLSVYDLQGRRVAAVLDSQLDAGVHTANWTGTDSRGLRLSSGVYVYELAMDGDRLTRRMILTR